MTDRSTTVDAGLVYEQIRGAFRSAIMGLGPDQLHATVAATPEWTVLHVLAHVTGLTTDLNAQHFPAPDDLGGVAWTQQQIADRVEQTAAEIIEEWNIEGPAFATGLTLFGYEFGSHFVADLFTHYQDVRGAIGLPPESNALWIAVSLDHYSTFIDEILTASGWGMLELVADDETRSFGPANAAHARLHTTPFEALRAFSARRSATQLRSLDWHGDVGGVLNALQAGFEGGYALPTTDVHD